MKKKSLNIILCFLFFSCCFSKKDINSIVNFDHLNHLTETITLGNELCNVIHIYAEYPDYNWVKASQEGIACVDDVARAVVVYLRYYEITGLDAVLSKAKKLLNFVLYMQADNGEFYNFIDSDLQINKSNKTSTKSFDFWAARGYWALGFGYKIFKSTDPDFAAKLKKAFLKCKIQLDKNLEFYHQFKEISNRKYPQWLINKTASDATSELLLGLAEFLKAEDEPQLKKYAIQLANGIIAMQVEQDLVYQGAFLSYIDIWHAWANAQTQALTSLGYQLQQPYMLKAAMREADNFYVHLLINKMLREWRLTKKDGVTEFPQLSYDVRCISLGLLRLSETTGNKDYAKLAGLAASWLMGNNAAKAQMYDPKTGRCFDGIIDSLKINLNSGAESTLEALYTIIEIAHNPIAKNYLYYKTFRIGSVKNESNRIILRYKIFKNEKGKSIVLIKDLAEGKFRLLEDEASYNSFLLRK